MWHRSRLSLLCASMAFVACSGAKDTPAPFSCEGAVDGTTCGAGNVCSGGACVAATTTRTVSGQFRTVFTEDAGATTLDTPQSRSGELSAVLVSSASAWTRVPAAADATGGFGVTDVPVGRPYLQLDWFGMAHTADPVYPYITVVYSDLVPLEAGTTDLATVLSARADLAHVSLPTPVTANVTNLVPWTTDSQVYVASAQPMLFLRPTLDQRPAVGSTSFTFDRDWSTLNYSGNGLPDPSRGDVVFWYQRAAAPVSSGSATGTVGRAIRYARLDAMAIEDGVATTLDVPLVDAPLTGSVQTAMKGSQFAALAADVNPAAQFLGMGLSVSAVPYALAFPDMPAFGSTSLFVFAPDGGGDVDFGTFDYGRFLDASWREVRTYRYLFGIPRIDGRLDQGSIVASEPMASIPAGAVVPVLGPPTAPLVNGRDAFTPLAGVGLEPTLSWSPPALGSATSYVLTLTTAAGLEDWDTVRLEVPVRGTSFKIPAGFLRTGRTYWASITARSAAWDVPGAGPFRTGLPLYTADCITAEFTP